MTTLLDSNVLIALTAPEHVHFEAARQWFAAMEDPFSTCPITQGSLVRYMLRRGSTASEARLHLVDFIGHRRHVFWPDDIGFQEILFTGVTGHRQVTDAYLAQLARHHGGRLATFDRGLAALHGDVAELIPTETNGH